MPQTSSYNLIAEMIVAVIKNGRVDTTTKQDLMKVIKIAREAGAKEEMKEQEGETKSW